MKYLRKLWFRILVSILLGAFTAEFVHMRAGEISPQTSTTITFIVATLLFLILTGIVLFEKYKYYYFPEKTEVDNSRADIIDDDLS